MTPMTSRSRSSTLQDQTPQAAEFQSQLRALGRVESTPEQHDFTGLLSQKAQLAHSIRQFFLNGPIPQQQRDTFRHLDGFRTLLVVLRYVSEVLACQGELPDERYRSLIDLVHELFRLLAVVLQDHKGNQKYFRLRVDKGGWWEIANILKLMLRHNQSLAAIQYEGLIETIFGCLLACGLHDESKTCVFSKLKQLFNGAQDFESPDVGRNHSAANQNADHTVFGCTQEPKNALSTFLKKEFHSSHIVHNEDAVFVIFELWGNLGHSAPSANLSPAIQRAVDAVPVIIHLLANFSTRNLVLLHRSGLVGSVIASLLSIPNTEAESKLRVLASTLLQVGVSDIQDARLLYRNAHSSSLIAELLLESLNTSRSPSYIHFDLSLSGFASVELPDIGRPFPPTISSAGYTLSLWLQITHFDPNCHTTIFGAFDASQTCFVLVYLEKDTHNLILQTSVSSTKPSVRFKSISFAAGQWYYVIITHRRPKTTSSSRASLFVDGEFMEQVKLQYPATAPTAKGNGHSVQSPSSNRRSGATQAFLGTPQDLASQLGQGKVKTQWRLASANLFADVLSDDLIAVYFELGSRYTGNYQDCLGSFQTYKASAALNLRNESLHPGKEEKSDILTAIRSKAGALLPESNILLNISANVILDDDDRNNIDESHLLHLLSKSAGKNLRNVTRGGRNALAINGAMPSVNEALLHSSGFAVLTGGPAIIVPQALDDAAWRVGGCAAVGLALLEAANQPEDIIRALKILLESVRGNWRNSEAMEREGGFGILSVLLSTKIGQQSQISAQDVNTTQGDAPQGQPRSSQLSMQVLVELLKFVGYSMEKPEDSVINNPLAYRTLLVDSDLWRTTEPTVQKLYYEQFIVFGIRSKYHLFNMKRLSRMRQYPRFLSGVC